MEEVYKLGFIDDDDLNEFDAETALNSAAFNSYLSQCCELEKVDLSKLNKNEKIAFFLNVYQCMYIHHYLRMESEGKVPKNNESMFKKLKSFVLDYSYYFYSL